MNDFIWRCSLKWLDVWTCSEVLAAEAVSCLNTALCYLKDIWEEIGIPEDQRLQRTNAVKNHIQVNQHRQLKLVSSLWTRFSMCWSFCRHSVIILFHVLLMRSFELKIKAHQTGANSCSFTWLFSYLFNVFLLWTLLAFSVDFSQHILFLSLVNHSNVTYSPSIKICTSPAGFCFFPVSFKLCWNNKRTPLVIMQKLIALFQETLG